MPEASTMRRAREIRIHRGLTQSDVARQIGVAESTLAGFEQSRLDLPGSKLVKLADALSTEPRELLALIPRPAVLPRHRNAPKSGGRTARATA